MGYGKVGFGRDKMCSYKHTHNSAVHIHEWGHNAGLDHEFGDSQNYMSYSKTKYEFSSTQLHSIFADGLSGNLNKGENSSTASSSSWFNNSTSSNGNPYNGKVSKGDKMPKKID